MRIPGLKSAKLAVRKLQSRRRARGVILGYHRIGDSSWDPFRLCVTPENFAEQLEVLRQLARPLGLDELVDGTQTEIVSKGVAVTFDDGYAECRSVVEPLLERHRVPATVFVVTGSLGEEFWWDRLARFFGPSVRDRSVRDRNSLVQDWYRRLSSQGVDERKALLEEIEKSLGASEGDLPRHRSLTPRELKEMDGGGRIRVGAHSHTHPSLGGLSPLEQESEIETSKAVLEEILARPARVFSYPHGSRSGETPDLVRKLGFSCACGSTPDGVFTETDPYDLPRIWVPDVGGRAFSKWLRAWIG